MCNGLPLRVKRGDLITPACRRDRELRVGLLIFAPGRGVAQREHDADVQEDGEEGRLILLVRTSAIREAANRCLNLLVIGLGL
jgi:hypothetical protein